MDKKNKNLNYISLFSSAGIGCYGFKLEKFLCVATAELIQKRLNIQKYNKVCKYQTGYILGDLKELEIKSQIYNEIKKWKKNEKDSQIDVLIATPPCQGISVANHKKNNEIVRNSLIVESIVMTKEIKPRFFIFENVQSFLNTICTDTDRQDKTIKEAIELNLGGHYNILYKVINFKNYGSPSSRTRTLVLGVRKDIEEITPFDLAPDLQKTKLLKETIGDLEQLDTMGQISKNDIYHNFRRYDSKMVEWISDLEEGQSAFQNVDSKKIPHQIIGGKIIYNQNKNGDKYTRCFWDKVAPCVHTRNDILASQNTIHPKDNRVFSIRELMRMMSIPESFKWSEISESTLNKMKTEEKEAYLKKEEINIRQSIGEGVPTIIFRQIAHKIRNCQTKSIENINKFIIENNLTNKQKIIGIIKTSGLNITDLLKIAELGNSKRNENAAFYTRQDTCFTIIRDLPDFKGRENIHILEPSIGVGNFLPLLFKKYEDNQNVQLDVVDIDADSIEILRELLKKMQVPTNFSINFINDDFLIHNFNKKYDLIIGNPPFKKIKDKQILGKYKENLFNQKTNNLFAFFVEKALKISKVVALVTPKSMINSPEFDKTRELLSKYYLEKITDYGEKGFKGIKIETISFILNTTKKNSEHLIKIESYITKDVMYKKQSYIFDKKFPYWLIYRNDFFDSVSKKLKLGLFGAFRDRTITKKHTTENGKYRVIKSRNIGNTELVDISGYNCFINDIQEFSVKKFLNQKDVIVVPNLTYKPRAMYLPNGSIVDGSAAILIPHNDNLHTKLDDLRYFNTEEFRKFYMIARNLGTRSLNIDNNSAYFFGIRKGEVL